MAINRPIRPIRTVPVEITSHEIRDVVADSALATLVQVAPLLAAGGIDVKALARAIGGNSAMILAVSLGLDGGD